MESSPVAYLAPHKYSLTLQDSAQVFPPGSITVSPQMPGLQPGLATSPKVPGPLLPLSLSPGCSSSLEGTSPVVRPLPLFQVSARLPFS